jgi:hypothetical protein
LGCIFTWSSWSPYANNTVGMYLKSMNLIKSVHLIYHHFVILLLINLIYYFVVLDYFSLACVRVLISVFLFLEN